MREIFLKGELKHNQMTGDDYRALMEHEAQKSAPDDRVLDFCVAGLIRFQKYQDSDIAKFKSLISKSKNRKRKRITTIIAAAVIFLFALPPIAVFGANWFSYLFNWGNEETVIAENQDTSNNTDIGSFAVQYDDLSELDEEYRQLCPDYLVQNYKFISAEISSFFQKITLSVQLEDEQNNAVHLTVFMADEIHIETDKDNSLGFKNYNGVMFSYFSNMQDLQATWEYGGHLYQLDTYGNMALEQLQDLTERLYGSLEVTTITTSTSDIVTTSPQEAFQTTQVITENKPISSSRNTLDIHFLDVGQGDSILIELPNNQTMLIDAGDTSQSDKIITYIHQQGYDRIDYLVATHPHSDHIGGMVDVINNFNISNIYISHAPHTSLTYENLITAIENSPANVFIPFAGDVILNSDDLLVEVVAPKDENYSNLNNASLVIKLTYDENVFLFTGDAEKEEEDSIWTNIKCDVLKVGHHGSDTSSTDNFLKKTDPTYAVISAGLGNSYGHPTDKVLQRLHDRGIKIFRTDLQGTIIATSNGSDILFNVNPYVYEAIATTTETAQTVEYIQSTVSEEIQSAYNYILNTNTKKIHYNYCSSARRIKDTNKDYTNDFESAIAGGYSPCGVCKP